MKTILLFPGIDAIESEQLRKKAIQWPEVVTRIEEAQTILDRAKVSISLKEVMHSKRQETLEWFSAMVLAAMAVQVGVFDRYSKEGKPIDILLGMSLGDLARSVCAGVSSFSSTFIGLLQFIQQVSSTVGSGSTYQVKLKKREADITSFLQCENFGVAISVYQSDVSFLVSGPIENLKNWSVVINKLKDVTTHELFKIPIPLHHELLKSVALSITPYIQKYTHFENKNHEIFSSIFGKRLRTSADLNADIVRNIYSPVNFAHSIHRIMEEGEFVEFINIGPAATMLAFIKQMDIPRDSYKLTNYFSYEIH